MKLKQELIQLSESPEEENTTQPTDTDVSHSVHDTSQMKMNLEKNWTEKELEKLRKAIELYGTNYEEIAKFIKTRSI